jgi:benzoyl-CoA reductase/2-hydroxyglutaryl-CoA dehydratase subunit BcrC/BadD/HgdB
VRFTGAVEALCDELEQRIARKEGAFPAGTPRVVLSGCPMAVPNWKVPAIIEGAGAVIVAEESCVGERSTRWLAEEGGKDVAEMIAALAERYLRIDCAVFTPNPSRLEHVRELSGGRKADGVIHYALQFCQPYQMEAGPLQSRMEKESVPTLCIDTDYSQEDVGQIRTRVEAFVERIRR